MKSAKIVHYQTIEICVILQKSQQEVHVKMAQEKEQITTRKLADIDCCMLCEDLEALKSVLFPVSKTHENG